MHAALTRHQLPLEPAVQLHEAVPLVEQLIIAARGAASRQQSSTPQIACAFSGVLEQQTTDARGAETIGHVHREDLGSPTTALVEMPERDQMHHRRDLATELGHEQVAPVGAIDVDQRVEIRSEVIGSLRHSPLGGVSENRDQGGHVARHGITEVGLHLPALFHPASYDRRMADQDPDQDADHVRELLDAAIGVQAHAHAPYSHFSVGAALRTRSGAMFVGCNVENAAFPEGVCAEAGAISAMVAAGERTIDAVVTYCDGDALATPCGGCRQKIREFADGDTVVHAAGPDGVRTTYTMAELLPDSFGPENLPG